METTNVTAIAIGGISAMVALANGWRMNTTAPSNGRKVDALVDATGDMCVRVWPHTRSWELGGGVWSGSGFKGASCCLRFARTVAARTFP